MVGSMLCVHIGHINNLNNTCIWKLVQLKGLTSAEAQQRVNVSCLLVLLFCVTTDSHLSVYKFLFFLNIKHIVFQWQI